MGGAGGRGRERRFPADTASLRQSPRRGQIRSEGSLEQCLYFFYFRSQSLRKQGKIGSKVPPLPHCLLLPPSNSLTSSPFFHSPFINLLEVLQVPSPCLRPFSHPPSQQSPFPQVITPYPSLLPFWQPPLYLFPSGQLYSPSPCFSLLLHSPRQVSPLSACMVAWPSRWLSRNSPSKTHPFCMSTPRPCFLLLRNSPVYVLPSRQLAAPLPLGRLCFHCPSQAYPDTSVYLPYPSATPLRKSPQYKLPSALMKRPCPSQLPCTNSPYKQSPQSNCREPLPWGTPASRSPEQQAPRRYKQTLFSSFLREECASEGSCVRRDLTPSARLEFILRTVLARMATWE